VIANRQPWICRVWMQLFVPPRSDCKCREAAESRISLEENLPRPRLPGNAWEFALESGDDEVRWKLASSLTNTDGEERGQSG